MNSFAALMGSLAGAGVSGAAGAGTANADASGAPGDGLFAGLLQANMAASPLKGDAAGIGLKAMLAGKDGASAPGVIDLATLLQATTDADAAIVPAGIPAAGASPIAPARLGEGAAPGLVLNGDAQKEGPEAEGLAAGPEGELIPGQQPPVDVTGASGAAVEGAPAPASPDGGANKTAHADAAPVQQVPAEARAQAGGRAAAAGPEHAAVTRPAHAQPNAASAAAPAGASGQPAAVAPHSPLEAAGKTADPQQASKAAHIAANAEAASGNAKRPTVLPAEGEPKANPHLARPVEIARTLTLAPNGQTVMEIIRSGKTDTGPAVGLDQGATTSIHVRSAATPLQTGAQQPQVPLNGIAVHIAQQAANGARRFDIRLDPPELGRIEVRLDVSKDGRVSTHLVVERSETLDLLQRDARALERALQNAGLDTTEGGMKFSLKDPGGDHAHSGGERQPQGLAGTGSHEDAAPSPLEMDNAIRTGRRYLATGGLDIRI